MNNFFCNHKTQKSDPEHTFSEIDINYRRDYSKGKSFKVSIWNEIDTYNNDDFIQDFVIYNQSLWARIDSAPSTNEVPTEGPWTKVMDGVSDVQFKEDGNKIFWKYEDESEWKDLFELDVVSESEIKNMLKDIATDVDSNFYDKTLSETSINAVQNKVITQALNKKADKTELSKKQDVISDLSEIRNKAKSALQSVPSEYVTESELANKGYLTEHQDISGKQDKIADLAQIRANAQKGATALQTVPSEYATKTDVSNEVAKIVNSAPKAFDTLKEIADWIEEDAEPAIVLANKVEQKVDKEEGLGLSEENYTTEDKEKLEGLENYDDTEIKQELTELTEKIDNINPTPMISVTYAELVALRNNRELVSGQQYRITDYETTTTQANTKPSGHPFDIIVSALDESTLSENASAIRSARDTDDYFGTENLEAWQLKYCLDNDTERFAWADNSTAPKAEFVAMFWNDPVNSINYNSHIKNDKIYDWGTEYDPETEIDNIVIYKTEVGKYNRVDYNDKYFYRGVVEVDGEEYDSWKKFEDSNNDWVINDEGQYQYALTERIVFEGQVIWPEFKPEIIRIYDSSNCAIKDEYDGGPDDSGYNALSEYIEIAAIMMDDPVNGDPYEYLDKDIFSHYGYETEPNGGNSLYLLGRYLDDGEDSGLCEDQKYYYRGVVSADGSDFDCWQKCDVDGEEYEIGLDDSHKYYFLTNKIVDGEVTIIESEKPYGGKGVIYNMIDEYGNECPYDFKNIKFYHEGSGRDVYTFTWIADNYKVMDTSVFGNNGTLTCSGEIYGVYGNVIKPYMEMIYDENSGDYLETKQSLNNITFISDYEWEGMGNEGFYGCNYNSFNNDCYNNSFGNNCHNNSFGEHCCFNNFSNNCSHNSFGYNCSHNSFGYNCSHNSFSNECYNNSFSEGFQSNNFGNYCSENSFGDNCCYNSFGNNCYSNSLSYTCTSNSFGNMCYNNIFSNDCYQNSFSNQCVNNRLGLGCRYNSFGEECYNNSFGANCFGNLLGNYCYTNTFGKKCNNNHFGNNSINNSFGNGCYGNSFGNVCSENSFGEDCSLNSFGDGSGANEFGDECQVNSFGNNCKENSFGNNCYHNGFGNSCKENSFGDSCKDNSLDNNCFNNIFGESCDKNSFGNSCQNNNFDHDCCSNSFGNNCQNNNFDHDCYSNSFGNSCGDNSFGNDFSYNSFGNECYNNSFGNSCLNNSFGNYCNENSFGDNCGDNSFGNNCDYNSFRLSDSTTATLLNYCYHNHFDGGCSFNVIWNDEQPTDSNKLQNINVVRGVSGTSSAYNFINIVDKNAAYEIKVAKNSNGDIKVYCETDLIS